MKSLVVYDSQYGNTKKVAEIIAKTLGGNAVKVDDFRLNLLKDVNLLIAGSPIQGWRPKKSVQEWLASLPASGLSKIKIAAFDTRIKAWYSGDAAKKICAVLKNKGGKEIIPPENFIVQGTEGPLIEGELERAKVWAKAIKKIYNL